MENVSDIKALRAYDLWDKEYPPNPAYIQPGILMKDATLLLGGEAKAGKSWMMLEFIRALSAGTPLFCNRDFIIPTPVRCLYVDAEIGERTDRDRFKKIFAEEDPRVWADNFFLVSKELGIHFNSFIGIRNLYDVIRDVRPEVLVLDPIAFLYHGDENSNSEIGKLFYMIAQAKQVVPNMSVIFSHHFKKRPYGKAAEGWDPLTEDNFRGASKWKDGGDTLITLDRFKFLNEKKSKWKWKIRFITRHGEAPQDGIYTFNEHDDLRIRFQEPLDTLRPLKMQPKDSTERKITFPAKDAEKERYQRLLFPAGPSLKPVKG